MFLALRRYQRIPRDGEEKVTTLSRRLMKFRLSYTLSVWLAFLFGFCLGLTVTLSFKIRSSTHISGRLPPVIPREVFTPLIPTYWVPDERYIGFTEYSNGMWHRLIQATESVWIESPSKHRLGKGFEAQFNHTLKSELTPQFYHISNLHQLHCLNIVRGRYFELQLDLPSLSKQSKTAAKDTSYHVDHCIEYLRMTIMCGRSWDTESNSPPGTPLELSVDPFGHPIGWGGIRDCVNWDALMSWQRTQLEAYKDTWLSVR